MRCREGHYLLTATRQKLIVASLVLPLARHRATAETTQNITLHEIYTHPRGQKIISSQIYCTHTSKLCVSQIDTFSVVDLRRVLEWLNRMLQTSSVGGLRLHKVECWYIVVLLNVLLRWNLLIWIEHTERNAQLNADAGRWYSERRRFSPRLRPLLSAFCFRCHS